MAIDRDDTLKKAEKLLRQGRLDAAIAEYERVAADYPRDWNTANALGDCYYRAHQVERAVEQYCRIADHFTHEGFFPKAAALYKKALKIKPDDEHALLQAAEIAIRQGILVEAKQYLESLADRRRQRGDAAGTADILVRIGTLDPEDVDARLAAARAVASAGQGERAGTEFRSVADSLAGSGQHARALEVLAEAARLVPGDTTIRGALVSHYAAAGEIERASEYATSATEFVTLADAVDARGDRVRALALLEQALALAPGERQIAERVVRGYAALGMPERARPHLETLGEVDHPDLLRVVAELRAEAGDYEASRGLFARLLAREPHLASQVAERGAALAATSPLAALVHIESAAETLLLHGDFARAASVYDSFLRHQPGHVPASLRLVEICVDGGLDSLPVAQAALTDAYLSEGRGAEARAVADDLVTTHPDNAAHVERLRRALQLSGEPDVEAVIAERLTAARAVATGDLGVDLSDEPPSTVPEPPARAPDLPGEPERGATASVEPRKTKEVPDTAPGTTSGRDPFGLGPIAIDLGDILGEEADAASADENDAEVDLNDALARLKRHPPAAPSPPARATPASLEAVFSEFRDEVDRHTEASAADQHYKVGLTYEEMGMVPEAVKELEIAVRAPRLRFEAASRLARLALKRGQQREAIEWFERAAEAPAPTVEAGRTLLYDLADTLEAGGETARALAVFLELQSDAADFRDVARRVERLARIQGG